MKTFFKKKPYALFLAPGFVLYSIFVIYPIFAAGKLSLYKWNGIGEKVYVGISNYISYIFTAVHIDSGHRVYLYAAFGWQHRYRQQVT